MRDFSSGRAFRVWGFHVSHSQLLIRSARQEEVVGSQNIDLRFTAVFYGEMSYLLWGVVITRPSEDDLRYLQIQCGVGEDQEHHYYCLQSGGKRYFVGAAHMRIEMNTLAPLETGFDLP